MKTPTFRAVLFDFDYTLADSSQGAIERINFALAEMKLAPVSNEVACRTIGLSLNETFRRRGNRLVFHHQLDREFSKPKDHLVCQVALRTSAVKEP